MEEFELIFFEKKKQDFMSYEQGIKLQKPRAM